MTTLASNPTDQWSLPSIDKPPLPRSGPIRRSAEKSGSSTGRHQHRSGGKSGASSRRWREKSGGTSGNRWTASEIAAYFGVDPNRPQTTPSMNSASSVFPSSSRYGESCTNKSGSRTASSKSYATGDGNPFDECRQRANSLCSTAQSVLSATQWRHMPDYEEKKQRLLKGKFRKQLMDYFPDLSTKRTVISDVSDDEAYDTDLDKDIGLELMCDERMRACKEDGDYPEYKRLCRKYGAVPNQYFLRHIMDENLHLRFRYLSYGDSHALNQPSISSLDLEDNAIGPSGIVCFADMLLKNSYITHVNLKDNGLGVFGARLLRRVLVKNARLVTVNISGNGFGERGARYLADVIDKNDTIKELYMSHNGIGDDGANHIGKALGNNIRLRTLDLSWNSIRRRGAFGLGKGLKANCTLEVLNLSMNGLHVEGTRLMVTALKGNETLKELDLSANRIEKEGARAVARALPQILQLTTLKLAFNPLTSEGAEQIVKTLIGCSTSLVMYLDLEGVTLEDYFQLLAEEFQETKEDSGMKILYNIPQSSRERSIDLPIETLTQLTELLDNEEVQVRELFPDVPEDDQLILSTDDLFTRVQFVQTHTVNMVT
ncbi:hypothetical protein BaRGS_00025204, partial [Batillaria attramentaria]